MLSIYLFYRSFLWLNFSLFSQQLIVGAIPPYDCSIFVSISLSSAGLLVVRSSQIEGSILNMLRNLRALSIIVLIAIERLVLFGSAVVKSHFFRFKMMDMLSQFIYFITKILNNLFFLDFTHCNVITQLIVRQFWGYSWQEHRFC